MAFFLFHLILSYSFILIFLIKWFLFYLILLKRKSWYIFLVFVMKNNHLKWGYKPCPCFVCILSLLFHIIDSNVYNLNKMLFCIYVQIYDIRLWTRAPLSLYFFFYQLWSFNDPLCVLHSYVRDRIDTNVNRRLPSLVRWIRLYERSPCDVRTGSLYLLQCWDHALKYSASIKARGE